MRRDEFETHGPQEIEALLTQAPIGQLGLALPQGGVRVVPVNFVYLEESIFFHGALDGEKFHAMAHGPRAAFSVDIPYALIPSHWMGRDYACPATQFFKSVHIQGKGGVVGNLDLAARVLNAIMRKYQPEGGYRPITLTDPLYKKALQEVAVYQLTVGSVSMKSKFGQNKSETLRRQLMARLAERNAPMDRETIVEIEKTLTP
ncbi:MAG: pyridoxamine 5'-phosphate oxidase family protein [Deltaproteobacteria bacterium]|nr:pyridoxamine 5'-phosphate oxidase family protein [Deltaproteobacteria bacterium]